MPPRLHPAVSLVYVLAVGLMLWLDRVAAAAVASLLVALLGGVFQKAPMLVIWLTVPTVAIVAVLRDLPTAVDTGVRVASLSLASMAVLALAGLQDLRRVLELVGLPPRQAVLLPLVVRQADIMLFYSREAMDGLRGRGLKGWRLLYTLPIPLLVSAFNSSAIIAEGIVAKVPHRRASRPHLPGPSLWDAGLLAFLALDLLLVGL